MFGVCLSLCIGTYTWSKVNLVLSKIPIDGYFQFYVPNRRFYRYHLLTLKSKQLGITETDVVFGSEKSMPISHYDRLICIQ